MIITEKDNCHLKKARKFQEDLLNSFSKRSDAILQLVEALASAEKPTSIVELCTEPAFQRSFSNVHKAIDALSASAIVKEAIGLTSSKNGFSTEGASSEEATKPESLDEVKPIPVKDNISEKNQDNTGEFQESNQCCKIDPILFKKQTKEWTNIFAELLPNQQNKKFQLWALDATPAPRPHAETLSDRSYIYQAGALGIPVTIGLQASVLVAIPEKEEGEAKWTLPLSIERIPSNETPCQIAKKQLLDLANLAYAKIFFSVIVLDSGYSCLEPQSANQVIIARSRINRIGRRPVKCLDKDSPKKKGRPKKYGSPLIHFAENIPMGDEGGPDEELEHEEVLNGRKVYVLKSRWNNVYIHGRSDLVDIVKIETFLKEDVSKQLFKDPLLLVVSGAKKNELTSLEIFECYLQRFDIEHFFRFEKQQLLFCGYQTPDLQRQINWWWICLMAYWLLYLVRAVAPESNRPWMPKRRPNVTATPGEVKRVFGSKIFPSLGSPTRRPVSRGKSKGRSKGVRLKPRERKKPIKKQKDRLKALP
jgi:hypothetical protein